MTPEEINREIADKVMGWTIIDFHQGHKLTVKAEWWCDEKGHPMERVEKWDPYHRIDHAWMVVEKMRQDRNLDFGVEAAWNTGYLAAFTNEPFGGPPEKAINAKGRADTAPAAICLAALAVKEKS